MSDITQSKSASTSTFVTALVFNAIVFAAELTAFTLLRPWFKAIYEPRTYVPKPSLRIKPLSPNSLFLWPWRLFQQNYKDIISANGMDAYMFVRFLRMMARVFLPIWIVSWIVLLPVTSVGTRVGENHGLDVFVFGNIENSKQTRYAAHLLCVYLFTGWIFYNIKIEMRSFILERQKHLISPSHARSVQANTILVTGVPAKYLSTHALKALFDDLPGGVKRIWINRNLKELPDIYDRRLKACGKLESAETALMKTAAKLRAQELKKAQKASSGNKKNDVKDVEAGHLAQAQVEVPRDKRPQHRLGFLPFTGEKVDTIEWAREEIRVCTQLLDAGRGVIDAGTDDERQTARELEGDGEGRNFDPRAEAEAESREVELEKKQADAPKGGDGDGVEGKHQGDDSGSGKGQHKEEAKASASYPPLNSAFVTFRTQIAAHLAVQVLTHHEPYRMSGKYIEVSPRDVIWANLNLNPYEQKIRTAIGYAATAGLIILWSFPVAFVGIVSNVYGLCVTTSWLAWLCDLPKVVVGIIAGILPPVLLAVLMMLLPIVLRLLARFEGIPKYSGLELELMNRFFVFQVIHSFLIVTLSSGIVKALPQLLNNPGSVPSLLAQNLPASSTFFLTYIVLQGLSGVAGGFLQIVPLIIYYVKLFILGSTPRAVYGIKYGLRNVAWGTTFPGVTLIVVIALGYSIISPIINGLACGTFFAFYQLYKYLFLYQFGQTGGSGGLTDTGGLFFPKAIQHVFVGMYVQQICLAALFFLARDENGRVSAVVEGAFMIILIVVTAGFHLIINNSYGPLLHALPLSLKDKTYSDPMHDTDRDGGAGHVHDTDVKQTRVEGPDDSGSDDHKIGPVKQQTHTKPLPDIEQVESKQVNANANDNDNGNENDYGFAHPATSRPQRTVWIPKDELGVWEEEERACKGAGVEVVSLGAWMDGKGKVGIEVEEVYGDGNDGHRHEHEHEHEHGENRENREKEKGALGRLGLSE